MKQFIQFLIINACVYIHVRNIYRGYNIQQSVYRSRIGALILHYISCDKNYVINRQATYELVIKLVKLPVSLDPCFQNTFSRQCSSRVSKKFPPPTLCSWHLLTPSKVKIFRFRNECTCKKLVRKSNYRRRDDKYFDEKKIENSRQANATILCNL